MTLNHSRISFLTRIYIRQFSEAGLHESVHFVILSAKSHEKLHLPLPGRFLSRRWITLCISMGFEPIELRKKQYKCQNYRSLQELQGTGDGGWRGKGGCVVSRLTGRLWVRGKKWIFGASCHSLTILGRGSALVPRISPSVVVRGCPSARKWPF